MLALLLLLLQTGFGNPILQAPPPPSPIVQSDSPSPAPQGGNTIIITRASDADIEHGARIAARAGMDEGPTGAAEGLRTLTNQTLDFPSWLLSRDKGVILENERVKSLNESLRYVGLGVWFLSLALIVLKHLAGPFVGVDILDLGPAFVVGMFFGLLGWFNEQLLGVFIDLAGGVIAGVANATLREAITPGLSFDMASAVIIGPILAVAYAIISLWLILKVWLQIAWLWILTAAAPIYITATGAPFLGMYGHHWWRQWIGTLLDPILVIVALNLSAPWLDFLSGAPPLAAHLARLATFCVILATLGWHESAYHSRGLEAVAVSSAWRFARGRFGGGSAPTPSSPAPPLAPNNPHALGFGSGTGGGTAASYWKTGRWATGHA